MASPLLDLKPQIIWKWFDKICSIPHPSYHDQKLVDFIANWAKENNYFAGFDEAGNLLLRKPATKGYEDVPSICLQAHSDMVPQANANKNHNFETDPITPVIKGEYLYADNTTLGADDGMGVAAILAAFEDDSYNHGPLEALITRDEEVGMHGAKDLRPNWIQSEYMLNLDTEEWGYLYLGCAGGVDLTFSKKYEFKPLKEQAKVFKIELTGFRGGHSGCDINTNRENAIKYLNKLLFAIYQKVKFNFCEYYAGQARNAIPREAYTVVTTTSENAQKFLEVFAVVKTHIEKLVKDAEQSLEITLTECEVADQKRISCSQMPQLLSFLVNTPNGVVRMSDAFAGVVESSLSVGIMRINPEKGFYYKILARSVNDLALDFFIDEMKGYALLAGMDFAESGKYHGWLPENSAFSQCLIDRYSKFVGKEVSIQVIHAGLECGIIKGHYPDIKLASIGPNIYNPHTPAEHVEIASVEKFYNFLIDVLSNFKG